MTDARASSGPPPPLRARARLQPGLRLQIVLALAGLMLLAFVPLFFAVASLTRATVLDSRERSARAIGRAIAAHVANAHALGGPEFVLDTLRARSGWDAGDAICVFSRAGSRIGCDGPSLEVAAIRTPPAGAGESARVLRGPNGNVLEVVSPNTDIVVVTRAHLDDETGRSAPLVRLVALYMLVFGLALLVFAYFALTRFIVRPVDQLVDAADRVANGARTLRVPRRGARELLDLNASVQAMAEKLISEEAALILKVDELTETTKRLKQTQAQLVRSERMASVGRLAAGVAHEIGNPIAALMGMEELLLEGDVPLDAQKDFLRRMRDETERIHTVVRDLLDFARPEGQAGAESNSPATADVCTVVEDVASLVRPQKPFRSVRLEAQVNGTPQVRLPANRLTQVLLNLVLNAGAAVASGESGSGRVTIRARTVEPSRVRIEVEDDGPGVAPSVRERLFEPFVTNKDVGEGTGLGLAVCRGLVESVGGEIGLDVAYEHGARFYVVLPEAGLVDS